MYTIQSMKQSDKKIFESTTKSKIIDKEKQRDEKFIQKSDAGIRSFLKQ